MASTSRKRSTTAKERYLTDEQGKRVAVVLDLQAYRRMIGQLEELADLRAYDAAKASGEKAVPIEQAIEEMDRKRNAARRKRAG